ncbi:MAG: hypothetical protein M1819_002039 [Sarea resinae]|nr:MAG: hypothetical protein M1819_002039 [Sarea resinae]
MSHDCHSEHAGHSHDGHGGHDHVHDHSDEIAPVHQSLLYQQVDFSGITTLNEAVPGSGAAVVQKAWAQHQDTEPELASDVDEQLLMFVPFTGQIKLQSVLILTSPSPSAPKTLHLFANRDDLDFSTASDLPPTQTLHLSQTSALQELPVKRTLFNATQSLTLFFADNFGDGDEDVTRVTYVGFKGEWMRLNREPVEFLYEAAANPGDHKAVVGTKQGLGSSRLGGAGGGGDGV